MKGIIPAAGLGTRLLPLTNFAPKALLPVYNKPMIYYPLFALKEAGIKNIILITSPEGRDYFEDFLRDGKHLRLKIEYAHQEKALGIAHALASAEKFAKGEDVVVFHSDNIFETNLRSPIQSFKKQKFEIKGKNVKGAKIILVKVSDPERFGVVEFQSGKIADITEKPKNPKSHWITAGCYMFDKRVFDVIRTLKPSWRGEYEITDIVKFYFKEGSLNFFKAKGAWFDMGTFESLHEASDFVSQNKRLKDFQF